MGSRSRSELPEYWKDVNAHDSQRRYDNEERNLKMLEESGVEFKLIKANSTVLLREKGKPKVDFYITKNKWKVNTKNKWNVNTKTKNGKTWRQNMHGDATSFINWYRKQTVK